MLLIVLLIVISLLNTRIPPNGADIDHPVPELNERAPFDGDVQFREVPQDEVHQRLVLLLTEPLDEGGRLERHPELVRREAVLREAEVEELRHLHRAGAQLLLLLDQVRPSHEPDSYLAPQLGQEL